jgi:Xaa-Pro aminopeptidase
MSDLSNLPRIMAGIPATNMTLYRRIQFLVGDPVAVVEVPSSGGLRSTLILRDIEMNRAKQHATVDDVACPADFTPEGGLSGDRETATAQAVAEFFRRSKIDHVVADRTLPMIFCELLRRNSIQVSCDTELGIVERRQKTEAELEKLRQAQHDTEIVMRKACETILGAVAGADGTLSDSEGPLTSESLRARIDVWLLEIGYSNPGSIVACGPVGSDCHHHGEGPLRTGQPIIVDIFPQNKTTLYNGDCTRTVVHGDIPDVLVKMHAAVVAAKSAATAALKAGVTGEAIHDATCRSLIESGYAMGMPAETESPETATMPHGTGHGIGLDVHEPPLLDKGGPVLFEHEVLTIEPALYAKQYGGIRVEDMVVVKRDGAESYNKLPEGLKLD